MTHSKIPSRRSRRQAISKRDIVSQVVHTQIVDMGLAASVLLYLQPAAVKGGRDALRMNPPQLQVLPYKPDWLLQKPISQLSPLALLPEATYNKYEVHTIVDVSNVFQLKVTASLSLLTLLISYNAKHEKKNI